MLGNKFLIQFILVIWCGFINTQDLEQPTLHANPVIVSDTVFAKLGTYRGFTDDGTEYQKTYFFTRHFKGDWTNSRYFCKSYDLELVTMETLEEARAVLTMADNNSILRSYTSVWLNIDAVTLTIKSLTEWFWTKSGKKISYPIPWRPDAPNNHVGNENCLTFGRYLTSGKFGFDDARCENGGNPIPCQRIDLLIPK
ncbi:unnamed protein product [Chironomus riparius]|uniref:C-type lectin domain-containing protein n=1 Tax=Chironomus riparius TaxID=315576 RepID=A0A9N9RXI8_9DIPT|nr:unnamed protein product [Chironomus riparius]